MSSVSFLANMVTLKGIENRVFLETVSFFLSIVYTECVSLPDYAEIMEQAGF